MRKVGPQVFYVKDEAGNLKPVINIKGGFVELKRMWDLDRGIRQPEQLPRYNLQQFNATGVADGEWAELDVSLQIHPRIENSWVRVPMGMRDAILREPAKHQGVGEFFIEYEEKGGYSAWIRTDSNQPHTLTMKLRVPLFHVGTQTRLALDAPRSTTSQLRLRVHADHAVGDVSRGADLNNTKYSKDAIGPVTEFLVLGLRNDFQLTWREGNRLPSRVEAAVEATGNVLVRIDGQKKTATADVRLNVQIAGGEIDSLQLLLPPGASNVRSVGADYAIALVENKEGTGAKPPDHALAAVTFDAKTTGAKEVHFIVELPSLGNDKNFVFEIGRFEVQQAVRQSGHIALVVEGDYSANWDLRQNREVRRVDELPDELREASAEVTLTAAFEYFRQPCSLRVQLEARTKHVGVHPTCTVTVDERKVVLDARLNYSIRSAKADFLDVDLDGWLVDRVVAVDAEGMKTPIPADLDAVRPLVIPLSPARTGDFEIRILAHQLIDDPSATLSFALPKPMVDSTSPARIIVQPADNIELTPLPDQTTGLLTDPDPVVAETLVASYQQPPLYLRQVDQPSTAVFVANFTVHTREIRVASDAQLKVSADQINVEQTLTYRILYERDNQLQLRLPQQLLDLDKVELELDRQPLAPGLLQASRAEQESQGASDLTVSLGAGKIGVCELVIRYQLPTRELPQTAAALVEVPLVSPAPSQAELTSSRVVIRNDGEIAVEPRPGAWKPRANGAPSDKNQWELTTDDSLAPLLLSLRRTRPLPQQGTVVRKGLIQTWLGAADRQDRAVFQISTGQSSVRVRLPMGVDPASVVALVDGSEANLTAVEPPGESEPAAAAETAPEIDIPVGDSSTRRTVRVEIWYPLHRQGLRLGQQLELPRVIAAKSVEPTYWQLITPGDEHLLANPAGVMPVLAWRWHEFRWERRSKLSTAELEKWIGASAQQIPSSTNQYLFTYLAAPPELHIFTLGRGVILLLFSGTALIVGMTLVYVPLMRDPRTLVVGGVALLLLSLAWPTTALLIAQASAVGLGLTMLSHLLSWQVARRAQRRSVVRGGSLAELERSSDYRPQRSENSSHATTATAPISLGMSPEAK